MAESPLSTERIAELERRLAADPDSPMFLGLADAYHRAGRLDDAEHTLRDGLERHPVHHSARTLLGRLLLETGRPDEARDHLEEVVAQAPENLLARRLLQEAMARVRAGEPRSSAAPAVIPTPERADPSPVDELSTVTLAELYLRQGDRSRAVEIYREVVRREPGNAAWREKLDELTRESAAVDRSPRPDPAPQSDARRDRPEGEVEGRPSSRPALHMVPPLVAPSRRVQALTRYLHRIQRFRERHAR